MTDCDFDLSESLSEEDLQMKNELDMLAERLQVRRSRSKPECPDAHES